jgi:hypothetical protein|tara:strand:+ start:131 stop:334 length:204 start_codon:yes stop_codon:yes gene_type:complete
MTPKEFVIWLRGVNVGLSGHPYESLWKEIVEKLAEVDTEEVGYIDFPIPPKPVKIPPSPGSPPEIIC